MALQELISVLYPKLLRYAVRQLNDQESARDVVQNAFEVLSKDLRKVADPAAFSGWIYQITHRKCVDHIRRTKQQRTLQDRYEADALVQNSIHQNEESRDQGPDLEVLLNKLSAEAYRLVHLHYLEGFSTKEIAKILAVPEGTVKSRLYAVREHLKSLQR